MKYLCLVIVCSVLVAAPSLVLAEEGVIGFPCYSYEDCTFSKIFGIYGDQGGESLFGNVYRFLVLYLAVPLATLSIVVGGIMYATSAIDSNRRNTGKQILTYAVIGLILTLSSYLIIKTVVNALVSSNDVGRAIQLR